MSILKTKKFILPLGVLVLCFAAIQFIRPALDTPEVSGDFNGPPEVKSILKRSCYNCHSNETRLEWYDEIAPAYWLVTDHVKQARAHLNFSSWDSLTAGQQRARLFDGLNQIVFGEMPRKDYSLVHPEARLDKKDIAILGKYIQSLTSQQPSDSAFAASCRDQYLAWEKDKTRNHDIPPSPNGITFMPEYRTWKVISTTDRLDNQTVRAVLANDVAVKAIEDNNINPWPDGSIIAKVVWDELRDSLGNVRTGKFWQVEYMIKDKQRYRDTKGWGWARWKGTELKPYGHDASFTKECITCHLPMKDNDYVFTMPFTTSGNNKK